ncbi:MAG: ABC transporter ATP-binding protein [Elainellaceae cyanobacterium]
MGYIRFDAVSLTFPRASRPAVNQCSVEIQEGQLVVLLGPSGCGKTTLLKMVNRLYEPTSGEILLNETPIQRIPATKLRQQIGYVIQQSGLFPHMTVAQNVGVVPKLLGWSKQKIAARVDELLELIGLPPQDYRDRHPAQLSGGQQQRIGLARALAADPKVMLMDEPFGALDAITRTALQNEILRLQRQLKKTILFVSHDVEEALRLADKILVMRAGQIVQYDSPFQILTNPANDFVRDLLGTDDMVRQLGILRVDTAMTGVAEAAHKSHTNNGHPTIDRQENLRQALSLILKTGSEELVVVDNGTAVGLLTLDHIRHSAQPQT